VDEVVEKVVVEEDGTAAILPRRHHLAATVVRRHRLVRVMYLDLIGAGGEREAVLVLVDEKGVPNDPRHHPRSFWKRKRIVTEDHPAGHHPGVEEKKTVLAAAKDAKLDVPSPGHPVDHHLEVEERRGLL
jgi:hypothetical protein